jgi:hypothetical protein
MPWHSGDKQPDSYPPSTPATNAARPSRGAWPRRDPEAHRPTRSCARRRSPKRPPHAARRATRHWTGPCRGREARETMTALAAVALRDVEGAGTERASKLLTQVAVVVPDSRDGRAKDFDRADGEVQNEETWGVRRSCLHALPSERTVTAPLACRAQTRGAGAVLSRLGRQARQPHPSRLERPEADPLASTLRVRVRLRAGLRLRI